MTLLTYPNPAMVPDAVKTLALKYAYTYIVQELLRLRHNNMGAKYRAGAITKAQWTDFIKNWYDPRSHTVVSDLMELRQACQNYQSQFASSIDLETIPI